MNFFEQKEEEEDYYKPKKVDKFYSDNFILHQIRDNKNETLSIEEYLNKIRPYLKDFINAPKGKYHTRQIHLTSVINCISSKVMMKNVYCIQEQ